jgi:hypothetical protein
MMKITSMVPLLVLEIEREDSDGFTAISFRQSCGVGDQTYAFPTVMTGKRFRITIEALDVTEKLES